MDIVNMYQEEKLTADVSCRLVDREGQIRGLTQPVLVEHTMTAVLNTDITLSFVCMPQYLPELIVGHLCTEGYIRNVHDIQQITVNETGRQAIVQLTSRVAAQPHPLAPLPNVEWDPADVFQLADAFAAETPMHNLTFAAHSCFLASRGEILFACEDLGRHNALDKAIGYAMIHGLKPAECILYSSGRMPADMVSKAIRGGFPVLISKGSPTAGAAELARLHGLTLICAARRDSFKILSDGNTATDSPT